MRDLKPNKNMTEIEYIEWIIDLFFANKRAYMRRADNGKSVLETIHTIQR